jgi:beta-lactamase regulating signal transducer with metallopeptidase domain
MDFTFFIFLQLLALFFLLYGMSFGYRDVRAGLTFISTLLFYMLSIASWHITKDFAVAVTNNSSTIGATHTISYVMPEMSQLNTIFMWISLLWIFGMVLGNAEEIGATVQFKMSSFVRKLR